MRDDGKALLRITNQPVLIGSIIMVRIEGDIDGLGDDGQRTVLPPDS